MTEGPWLAAKAMHRQPPGGAGTAFPLHVASLARGPGPDRDAIAARFEAPAA